MCAMAYVSCEVQMAFVRCAALSSPSPFIVHQDKRKPVTIGAGTRLSYQAGRIMFNKLPPLILIKIKAGLYTSHLICLCSAVRSVVVHSPRVQWERNVIPQWSTCLSCWEGNLCLLFVILLPTQIQCKSPLIYPIGVHTHGRWNRMFILTNCSCFHKRPPKKSMLGT